MIPQAYINEWRMNAPWLTDAQVEQDLILSRAIIEIFSEPLLASSLAFRGGTALHKLFFQPPARYSEDIDLVQITAGSIGVIFAALRKQLNPWLGDPKWKLNADPATFVYRFNSESHSITPMRLKVEINTRQHFTVLGLQQKSYEVKNTWFSEQRMLTIYTLEELLGTKLRALYQRKKGRDLFDLVTALKSYPSLEITNLIECFNRYTSFSASSISRAAFEANLAEKLNDTAFIEDIKPLLPTEVSSVYDPTLEIHYLKERLIDCLI